MRPPGGQAGRAADACRVSGCRLPPAALRLPCKRPRHLMPCACFPSPQGEEPPPGDWRAGPASDTGADDAAGSGRSGWREPWPSRDTPSPVPPASTVPALTEEGPPNAPPPGRFGQPPPWLQPTAAAAAAVAPQEAPLYSPALARSTAEQYAHASRHSVRCQAMKAPSSCCSSTCLQRTSISAATVNQRFLSAYAEEL